MRLRALLRQLLRTASPFAGWPAVATLDEQARVEPEPEPEAG